MMACVGLGLEVGGVYVVWKENHWERVCVDILWLINARSFVWQFYDR